MKKLVLGIDGGGTKTDIALADLKGNILKKEEAGPASLRNTGVDESCKNILEGVRNIFPVEGNIVSTFIGFPAIQEEYSDQKDYIRNIFAKEISGKINIGSDQLVAFKSGTSSGTGIVLIAGTGGVVRGFKENKSAKASGWGYFGDEGSAFWVGIEAYRKITKQLDGRGKKTKITEMLFKEWGIEKVEELNKKVYQNPMRAIPKLSIMVDYAEREGDEIARSILEKAAEELSLSVRAVVEDLELEDTFPLILIGGMFKSKFLEEELSNKINKFANIEIIKPEKGPVFGAVKLAISNYEEK
ncbi:MAG: BadF/BadG/BcrA/BcrD ATPase family protein [Patescibacteria group bacterium]